MSGQLGELVISLQADIARFREDMGKATKTAQDSAKSISASFDVIPAALNKITMAAGAVTAVLAGGAMFKDMISTTKDAVGEVVKLSKVFGVTAQQASVMRVALDDAFLTVDDAVGASDRLTRQALKNGKAFADAGIDIKDSNGNLKDSMTIMMEVNDHLKTLKEGKDRDTAAMALYGKGWRELSGILRLTSEGMKEAENRAKELNLIFGDDKVVAVKKYKMAMKDIGDVSESLKVTIGNELIPVLTDLAVAFGEAGTGAASFFAKVMHEGITDLTVGKTWVKRQMGRIPMDKELLNWSEYTERQKAEESMYWYNLERGSEKYGGLSGNGSIVRARSAKPSAEGRMDPSLLGDAAQEAERARNAYNEGVRAYNQLVEEFRKSNPDLTDTAKKFLELDDAVAKLSKEHPEQAKDASHISKLIKKNLERADAIKKENAEVKESIKLMEEMNKEYAAFSTKGLSQEFGLKKEKSAFSLLGDSSGAPIPGGKYSLTGPAESKMFGGNGILTTEDAKKQSLSSAQYGREYAGIMANGNPYEEQMLALKDSREQQIAMVAKWDDAEIGMAEKKAQSLKKIDDDYAEAKRKVTNDTAGHAISSLSNSMTTIGGIMMEGNRKQFAMGKALSTAGAVIDTYKAATGAYAAMASIPYIGPALGAAAAAAAVTLGMKNVAMINSASYQGRETGGNVSAGTPYIVGEKRPELFVPGQSGTIIPYVPQQQAQAVSQPVVNIYEDKSKAGKVENSQKDGNTIIDIFVADLMGDGRVQKAMSRKFGMQPVGA